jgi:hypothetical protein
LWWLRPLSSSICQQHAVSFVLTSVLRSGRTYIAGTILQATAVATGASATTLVGVDLGAGLTVSGTSQTAIYSTNGELA